MMCGYRCVLSDIHRCSTSQVTWNRSLPPHGLISSSGQLTPWLARRRLFYICTMPQARLSATSYSVTRKKRHCNLPSPTQSSSASSPTNAQPSMAPNSVTNTARKLSLRRSLTLPLRSVKQSRQPGVRLAPATIASSLIYPPRSKLLPQITTPTR